MNLVPSFFPVLLFCNYVLLVSAVRDRTLKINPLRCGQDDATTSGYTIYLMDNLLKDAEVKWLNDLAALQEQWILNDCSREKQNRGHNTSCSDRDILATWLSPIPAQVFEGFLLWKQTVDMLYQLTSRKYSVCQAMFTKSYRMDFHSAVSQDENDDHSLTARIFLNAEIGKNHYGEHVFYTTNNMTGDDVSCGVFPVAGRALIWNGSVGYSAKPPSMLYQQSLDSIFIKLTDSEERHKACLRSFEATNEALLSKTKVENFPFTKGHPSQLQSIVYGDIDFESYLTKKYYNYRGYEVAVFDDVLVKEDIDVLRSHLINDYNSLRTQPYNTDKVEDNDNVSWISVQKVATLVQSDLWKVIKGAVVYLSGSDDDWYPYDVSMNVIRSFDHTRIHEDCEEHEHEYTFLLYLNPEWDENFYGETVFYDQVHTSANPAVPGDERYEIITAIQPRYGRIALFRGIIPHSARPPSPYVNGARYTFACKVSKTYRSSTTKQLWETMERLGDAKEQDEEFMAAALAREDDSNNVSRDVKGFLELELKKQKRNVEEFRGRRRQDLTEKLSGH